MADDVSEKFVRGVRAGLNGLLDQIKQFDLDGDGDVGSEGFEHIGQDAPEGPSYSPPKPESEKTLRDYYANLELEYGASMDEVKASYRSLMRKYHPDKFSADPRMEEISTQISQELTRAYRAIEAYWATGQY